MIRRQQTATALGSEAVLTLIVKDEAEAKLIFVELWHQIVSFEQRFSRFQEKSELSEVNRQAGVSVPVSKEFLSLAKTAKQFTKITDGLYNPLILPALQQAGYVSSWLKPQSSGGSLDFSKRQFKTTSKMVVTASAVKIPDETALDFGGIGKGYLLDQLASYLDTKHVKDYWLSLGGDIICGGYDLDKKPWEIGLAHAKTTRKVIQAVVNKSGKKMAVATSGITKRAGPGWHHIIDPRTGRPAETDILSATVVSTSATKADIFAKCLVILGSQTAPSFLAEKSDISALLQVWHNKHIGIETYGDSL